MSNINSNYNNIPKYTNIVNTPTVNCGSASNNIQIKSNNSSITDYTTSLGSININYDPNLWTSSNTSTVSWTYTNVDMASIIARGTLKEFTLRAILIDGSFDGELDNIISSMLINYQLSIEFIKEFYSLITTESNFINLLHYQHLPESFLEEHMSDIQKHSAVKTMCEYQTLSIPFIEKLFDMLTIKDINAMIKNNNIKLTYGFIAKHKDRLYNKEFLNAMGCCNSDYQKLFNKIVRTVDKYDVGNDLDWKIISWSMQLDEDIIEKYIDYIDFNSLILANRKFKSDFINCFLGLIKKDI